MRRRSKAQLNAISRSYTAKTQKESLAYLESKGINFDQYCKDHGWRASATRLATKIREEERKNAN